MKSSRQTDSGYIFKVETISFVHFAAYTNEKNVSVS